MQGPLALCTGWDPDPACLTPGLAIGAWTQTAVSQKGGMHGAVWCRGGYGTEEGVDRGRRGVEEGGGAEGGFLPSHLRMNRGPRGTISSINMLHH